MRTFVVAAVVLALTVSIVGVPRGLAQGKSVLVVAQAGDIDSLDNDKALGPSKNAIILCSDWQYVGYKPVQLSNGAWTVDTKTFVPRIVESWEDKALPDGRYQYTLHVKRGLRHHSGNPITASDIAFSFLRRQAFNRDTLERSIGYFNADKDIQIVDDYTIRFTAARFAPLFYQIMTQRNLYDSKKVKEMAGPGDPWGENLLKKNCVAGGPYTLGQWTPGVEMVFNRWPQWWGNATWEKTSIDQIVLRVIPSVETRALLLQRGNVDIALDLPVQELNRLRSAQGVKILSYPSQNMLIAMMNPAIKPFDDRRVRQAMVYAFPYQAAISSVFRGAAQRLDGPIPSGVALARKVPPYSTDLEKARRLLAEAGFGGGLTVPLTFDAKYQTHEDLAVLYKANLEKIGIRAEIQKMPSAEFNTQTRARKVAFFFYEELWWVADPLYSLALSFDSASHDNVAGYRNPQVDAMLAHAQTTADTKARLRILEQVQNFVIDDAAWLTIAEPNFDLAVRDSVMRYVHQNTELNHLWLVQKR